jgi:hypothetical protein
MVKRRKEQTAEKRHGRLESSICLQVSRKRCPPESGFTVLTGLTGEDKDRSHPQPLREVGEVRYRNFESD